MATIHTSQCHINNDIHCNISILKAKLLETLEHVDEQIWIIPDAEFKNDSLVASVDIVL